MARNLVLWLVIAAVLLTVFNNFSVETQSQQINYSQFVEEVNRDQIRRVIIDGQSIIATRANGDIYETVRPAIQDPKLMDDLLQHNVEVEGRKPEQQSVWMQLLVASFPRSDYSRHLHVFHAPDARRWAAVVVARWHSGRAKQAVGVKIKSKQPLPMSPAVDEAKEDVQELVEFLRDPGEIPKAEVAEFHVVCLMVGQPGTGKTLLAKAIAGEAKVPFFPSRGQTLLRCSSVLVRPESGICLSKPRNRPLVSSLSMKLMLSVASGAPDSGVAMMSASKPLTSCWSRWMASR